MKKIILMALLLTFCITTNIQAGAKREARKAYIIKQTKLTSEQKTKVLPVLEAYRR